jgi:tetratricopeptide (TPR) repeat protein
MGGIYFFSDLQSQAAESLEEALCLYRELGDRLGEANILRSLGDVERMRSDYGAAEQLYQQALPLYRELRDRLGEAGTLKSLGDVEYGRSDYGAAEQLYRNALDIFSTIGDKYSQGITLQALAEVYRSWESRRRLHRLRAKPENTSLYSLLKSPSVMTCYENLQ